MKLVKAIIQPYKLKDVQIALKEVEITRMTVSNALGAGVQQGYAEKHDGTIHQINLLKKTVIEIALNDKYVDKAINAISKGAYTGKIGDGKIFVTELQKVIRIRTQETNENAIG